MAVTTAVIIPTSNRPQFLRQALHSIMVQSVRPTEIVVVSDGRASSATRDVERDFPNTLFIEQEKSGAAIARNTGIAATTSDWLLFLDDDDLWEERKLEKVLSHITKHPTCEAIHHHGWFFSAEDGPSERYGIARHFVANNYVECQMAALELEHTVPGTSYVRNPVRIETLLSYNAICLSTSCIRRDVLIRAGCFPPSLTEDWRMAVNVARITHWQEIPERLSYLRFHGDQTTATQASGVTMLSAYLDLWFAGLNPLTELCLDSVDRLDILNSYSKPYRDMLQSIIWTSLKSHHYGHARLEYELGRVLLRSRRDRYFALLPPRLTSSFARLQPQSGAPTPTVRGKRTWPWLSRSDRDEAGAGMTPPA